MLLAVFLVISGIVGDFAAVWIAPLFTSVTSQELWNLAIQRLDWEYQLSYFVWNLPVGFILSMVFNFVYERKLRNLS